MAGCPALQEFEDQLFCRRLGVPEEVTSSRVGEVKIFEFVIKSFRESRCVGCDFFRRRG